MGPHLVSTFFLGLYPCMFGDFGVVLNIGSRPSGSTGGAGPTPSSTVETTMEQRSAKLELILWAIASLAAILYTYLV